MVFLKMIRFSENIKILPARDGMMNGENVGVLIILSALFFLFGETSMMKPGCVCMCDAEKSESASYI